MATTDLAKRRPWTALANPNPPPYATSAESLAWHKENSPFSVRWTYPSSEPGLYGWQSVGRPFKTEAEALAVAHAPMGIAFDVEVIAWDWDRPSNSRERGVRIYTRKNAAYSKGKAKRRA